jgi:iron complex outermembrane receptor protein
MYSTIPWARNACFTALFVTVILSPATRAQGEPANPPDEEGGHAHEHPHDEHGETETIVVTASPLEHDRDELSLSVDRIDRDELLENLGSSLGESLSHIPGIASSGFSAGASRPVIRGQDAYRTEVLEDGLRTQDVSRESPDHAVPTNPLSAKRVEIVRGPATLRYGGGASAGVVNVITNRVPDRVPPDSLQGEIFAGVGLAANERDLAAILEGGLRDFAWHADGLLRRANDYSIPNDDRPRIQSGSQVDAFMGSIGGAYFGDLGRIGASYTRAENDYGIPEVGEPVEVDMHTDRFRFEGDVFDPVTGIRELRVRGVYSDYEHKELTNNVVGQSYRNKEFEGRLEALHEEFLGVTGAFGFHTRYRDFRGEGEAAEFLAPAETTTAAAYLFEEYPATEALTLEAGFRFEHTRVQGVDISDTHRDLDFTPLSGALGLVATPAEWLTIGASASASQRAPSQVELLARGPHEATGTFEIGDPSLDEETSFTGDLRVEIKGGRGRFQASAFLTQYDDFILASLTGLSVDETGAIVAPGDPSALDQLVYSNRDALFWGTEILGEVDLFVFDAGAIGVDGRFDYVRARFDSNTANGSRDLPRIVPIRWGGSLFFEGEALEAHVGFTRTEAQEKIAAGENPTKSFTMLHASLICRLDLIDEVPLELSVVGRNLTDVRGRNHVAFNKDEVLLPGRSIRFGLRAQF